MTGECNIKVPELGGKPNEPWDSLSKKEPSKNNVT